MIHAVSIEIILHLPEARFPPSETVFRHLIPVIRRETPVLTGDREIIGRCSCRCIQIEQLRINGRIYGIRRDTDRYIALHSHADRVGVRYGICQLLVRMELQELIEILGLLVTLCQESGVRLQPSIVFLDKRFIFRAGKEGIFVLLVQRLEEHHFLVIHILIVRKSEGVQLRFLRFVFLLLRRRQLTHLLDIDIYRMEGKDGNGVIGITIQIVMTKGGIIDRQCLDHLLTRSRSPVRHFLEVLELTNTESFVATKRENRNCHTGTFPARLSATESTVVLINNLTLVHTPYLAVLSPFGIYYRTGLEIIDEVFIFHYILPLHFDVCAPERELGIGHNETFCSIPVTERFTVTDDRYSLTRQNLRKINGETDITLRRFRFRGFMTFEKRLEESRGIE